MSRRARRFGEGEAVRELAGRFGGWGRGGRGLGIGDDAAILDRGSELLVWTVDACVEGVHFERRLLGLADVGYRSFQAAASDLAAMGARPIAALSALELPRSFSRRELAQLTRGQAEAARRLRCPIVGGNLSRGQGIAVTTTVLGEAERPVRRSGARVGDELWLVGRVGLAAAGFLLLTRAGRSVGGSSRSRCIAAWRRPSALIAEGRRLGSVASSAIDVSDGLAGDAGHLAEASGVAVVIETRALERTLSPALRGVAPRLGRSAIDLALSGGEDYALLATGRKAKRPSFARPIGRIERGAGAVLEDERGERRPLAAGFDHFD